MISTEKNEARKFIFNSFIGTKNRIPETVQPDLIAYFEQIFNDVGIFLRAKHPEAYEYLLSVVHNTNYVRLQKSGLEIR